MIQFLMHEKKDTVAVATVNIKAGEVAKGRYLDTQEPVEAKVVMDIPLGHKLAVKDHQVGDTVYKYGHDIGKVTKNIKKGEYVHIHNLKTKRW